MKTNQPQRCNCPRRTSAPIHMTSMTMLQRAATIHATTEMGEVPIAVTPVPLVWVCAVMKKIRAEIAATTHAPMYQRVVTRLLTGQPPAAGRLNVRASRRENVQRPGQYALGVFGRY